MILYNSEVKGASELATRLSIALDDNRPNAVVPITTAEVGLIKNNHVIFLNGVDENAKAK